MDATCVLFPFFIHLTTVITFDVEGKKTQKKNAFIYNFSPQ